MMEAENKQPKRESQKLNKICDICADVEGDRGPVQITSSIN